MPKKGRAGRARPSRNGRESRPGGTTAATSGPRRIGPALRRPRSGGGRNADAMIRIAITTTAFEAIAATLPLGSVGYEDGTNEKGERLIWLPPHVVNRLRAMRGPKESYSDVIPKLAAGDHERKRS